MVENIHTIQVAREKSMPVLVRFLCGLDGGCWVVGSRADFRRPERITPTSDWDLLVPHASWEVTAQAVLAFKESDDVRDLRPTRYGGWRFEVPDKLRSTTNVNCTALVDVFAGDVGAWLLKPHTLAAWHPKSGTIVEKPLGEVVGRSVEAPRRVSGRVSGRLVHAYDSAEAGSETRTICGLPTQGPIVAFSRTLWTRDSVKPAVASFCYEDVANGLCSMCWPEEGGV